MLTLFKQEKNISTTPAEAGDNDYSTWTTQTTVVCAIGGASFDHIFVKCSGVTSYAISVDGTSHGTRTLPESVPVPGAVPAIADVNITRDGWQHDLHELSQAVSGSSVTLTFTGSNVRINEVLILEKSIIITEDTESYVRLSHSKVDINSVLLASPTGGEERVPLTGVDRLRWQSNVAVEFTFGDPDYEVVLDWIEDNPACVVSQYPLYPWRVYKAIFPELRHRAPYICHVRETGNIVEFRLLESRKIGANPLVGRKTSFNTVDDQDVYLFFNDCVHLKNERVTKTDGSIDYKACDNDFSTFSEETTLDFDISDGTAATRVTHVFLKSTGVTSYQIQTLVGSTWTTQETVTPTEKTYRGWDASLEKLTTAISATRVRLVFAGSGIKVSEIMLLEHAGGLKAVSDVLPTKTDRTGSVQQLDSGEVVRERPLGAGRFRWGLDFSAVFRDPHSVEDFLDWINWNPKYVFGGLPGERPWHVYPAGFGQNRFDASFLTDTVQIGERVGCQISER